MAAAEAMAMLSSREVSEAFLRQDDGNRLVGISIAFIILTTIFIGLRLFSRRFTVAPLGLDDFFILAAYVVDLGMCAICIVSVKLGGVGRHIEFIEEFDPKKQVGWAQAILAFEIVYFASVALPKIAIMFMYLRILNWEGAMRKTAYVLIFLLAATSLSLILAACFQCQPLAYWWDRTIPGGSCFDVQSFFHAQAIPGAILDLVVMALPLQTIWHLRLPLAKRIALVLIFAIGSFGIVASVIRATVFFATSAFADRTFASVDLLGWSVVETGTYIIAGCLPSTRPLFSHYTPPWLKSMVRKGLSYVGNSVASVATRSRSHHGKSARSHSTGRGGGSSVATGKRSTALSTAAGTPVVPNAPALQQRSEFDSDDDDEPTNDDEIALRPYPRTTTTITAGHHPDHDDHDDDVERQRQQQRQYPPAGPGFI